MLESIWTRSSGEAFLFFAVGLALWETFAARAAARLGTSGALAKPFRFGICAGLIFGAALIVYSAVVSAPAFSGVEGNAFSVAEKLRIAAFPASAILAASEPSAPVAALLLLAQNAVLGAAFSLVFRKSSLFVPQTFVAPTSTANKDPDDASVDREID